MKSGDIITLLRYEYPDKNIVALPSDSPTEIICEIEPTRLHPEFSTAIAYIDKSEPHYHLKSTETYHVEEGQLVLFVGDKKHILEKGQSHVIQPGQVHWTKGEATKVRVDSSPGWTSKDHILVQEEVK